MPRGGISEIGLFKGFGDELVSRGKPVDAPGEIRNSPGSGSLPDFGEEKLRGGVAEPDKFLRLLIILHGVVGVSGPQLIPAALSVENQLAGVGRADEHLVGDIQAGGEVFHHLRLGRRVAVPAGQPNRPVVVELRIPLPGGGDEIVVVSGIGGHAGAELFQIGETADRAALFLRLVQRRQQHRRKDCNDCNNNQQFYYCETVSTSPACRIPSIPLTHFVPLLLTFLVWQQILSE